MAMYRWLFLLPFVMIFVLWGSLTMAFDLNIQFTNTQAYQDDLPHFAELQLTYKAHRLIPGISADTDLLAKGLVARQKAKKMYAAIEGDRLTIKDIPASLLSVGSYKLDFARLYLKNTEGVDYVFELCFSGANPSKDDIVPAANDRQQLIIGENIHLLPMWYTTGFDGIKEIIMTLDFTPVIDIKISDTRLNGPGWTWDGSSFFTEQKTGNRLRRVKEGLGNKLEIYSQTTTDIPLYTCSLTPVFLAKLSDSTSEIRLDAIVVKEEYTKKLKKIERNGNNYYRMMSVEWNELVKHAYTPGTFTVKLSKKTIHQEEDEKGLTLAVSSGKSGVSEKLIVLIGARVPGKNYPMLIDALIVDGAR